MALRDRLTFLETRETRHSAAIRALQQETASLSVQLAEINQRLEQAEGRVILVDETPSPLIPVSKHVYLSAPYTSRFQTNCSDETGDIILNSLDESLRGITAHGDPDLQAILRILDTKGFDDLIKWRPTNSNIKSRRSEIIRWILHPTNIHKFRNKKVVETTSQSTSVWMELAADVFPEASREVHRRIMQVLAVAAKSLDSHFGSFVAAVISAHNSHCTVRHV